MELIIASNNKHKIREIKKILGGRFANIRSLAEAGIFHETVEDGKTFLENAVKKAREISEISGVAALADDSGICVDALGGAPGIYSARFAGGCSEHSADEDNNKLLLEKLSGEDDRRAHYTAAVAIVWPDGRTVTAEGHLFGEIIAEPRGEGGFGYDPLFVPEGESRTVAEMTDSEKNEISHRARALEAILKKL